jgi:GTP cyclohydrolase I
VDVVTITLDEVVAAATSVAHRHNGSIRSVYGVPRGGLFPAAVVAGQLRVPLSATPERGTLVVDDLVDSGATLTPYTLDADLYVDALFRKSTSPSGIAPHAELRDGWLVFPWEHNDSAGPEDAVLRLLNFIGEDATREGLVDTPGRVCRSLAELTGGYNDDPATILSTVFTEQHDQMVVLDGVEFTSLCEHHMLPFVGTAVVGYVPRGKVVGLSKLARLVECYARRLQVQERMTEQIALALMTHLEPEGAGVVIRAHHSCMGCRGVRKPSARMTTSALLGIMRYSPDARSEFLAFAH